MNAIICDDQIDAGPLRHDEPRGKLIDMIGILDGVIESDHGLDVVTRLFAGLLASIAEQFHAEEQQLRDAGFPGCGSHKREHDELLGKADDLNRRLSSGDMAALKEAQKFLRDWLKGHLLGTDVLSAPYLTRSAPAAV